MAIWRQAGRAISGSGWANAVRIVAAARGAAAWGTAPARCARNAPGTAASPPMQHRSNRLEPFVRVTRYQLDPSQTSGHEPTEERQPERSIFARSHIQGPALRVAPRAFNPIAITTACPATRPLVRAFT